jgi:23S rRNA (guanosine2251-2'-O)-methyltransferase
VGAESRGVGHAVELACDFLARIPLFGEVESLNASVAFGVAAFEALRQRRGL